MKIAILTVTPEADAAKKLKDAFVELKHDVELINPDNCILLIDTEQKLMHDGKEVTNVDCLISRFSDENSEHKLAIISYFESTDCYMLNTRVGVELANNKLESQLFLLKHFLKTPRSVSIVNSEQLDSVLVLLKNLEFPVIIKTLTGCGGVGVIKADSLPSLLSIIQVLIEKNVKFVVQEFIKNDETFRILTIGGKCVSAMKRKVDLEKDFRSNSALDNSSPEKYEPSAREIEVAEFISKETNLNFCALDYILDDKGEPVIFEFNSSPGFETIEKANDGLNVGKLIADFCIANCKSGNVEVKKEVELEVPAITIVEPSEQSKDIVDDIEKIVDKVSGIINSVSTIIVKHMNDGKPFDARVDTGATHSCIHGDTAEISGNTVTFKHNNIIYRCPLTRVAKIRSSDGGTLERPVITLDIILNIKSIDSDTVEPKSIDGVEFTITDRNHMKYDVLIGRSTLEKAGILVSPDKESVGEIAIAISDQGEVE